MSEIKTKEERKDFEEWKVTIAYMAQDGVCTKCGNSLEHGFHRHHKDLDNANNHVDNLELICRECHHATFRGRKRKNLSEHKTQEKAILGELNKLIQGGIAGTVSGALAGQLMEAMALSLKVSRKVYDIDLDLEYPPPAITLMKRLQETQVLSETFLDGYKRGVDSVRAMDVPESMRKQLVELHLDLQNLNRRLWDLGQK